MRSIVVFLSVFIDFSGLSQGVYFDSTYSQIEKVTYPYATTNGVNLEFDFYRALEAKGNQPLVVFVHGGGFSTGKRSSYHVKIFARELASRGYSVASVSYRLTMKDLGFGCETSAEQKKGAIDTASLDVTKAIKEIIVNKTKFKVDPNRIVLVGSSAGAETVLNMAYLFDYKSILGDVKFAGVISMAGALLDVKAINEETAIPTQLFHGTGDILVPYEVAPHHYCEDEETGYMMLYGSAPIIRKLSGLGATYYSYIVEGAGHEWAHLPFTNCFTEMNDFLYNDVIYKKEVRQTNRVVVR